MNDKEFEEWIGTSVESANRDAYALFEKQGIDDTVIDPQHPPKSNDGGRLEEMTRVFSGQDNPSSKQDDSANKKGSSKEDPWDNPWNLNLLFTLWKNKRIGRIVNVGYKEETDIYNFSENEKKILGPLHLFCSAALKDLNWFESIQGSKLRLHIHAVGIYEIILFVSVSKKRNENEKTAVIVRIDVDNIIFNNFSPENTIDMNDYVKPRFRMWCEEDSNDVVRGLSRDKDYMKEHFCFISDNDITEYKTLLLETQNARAAIMSRNGSHNLGSHILSHLHNDLEDSDYSKSDAYTLGVSHFVKYLQERQDYIATIANNDIGTMFPANFKNVFYDIFNPDYIQLRHVSAKKCENIILHYIAYSEGFQRPLSFSDSKKQAGHDIKIFYGAFDGTNQIRKEGQQSLEDMRYFNLALPALGNQAFFSILENIIRNAAKHDKNNVKDDLIVRIDRYDCFSERESYSNDGGFEKNLSLQEIIRKYYIDKDPDDNYHYITITINNNNCDVSVSRKTLNRLRNATKTPFIDDDGSINKDDRGIKEIRICASWLRGGVDPRTELFPLSEDLKEEKSDAYWKHDFLTEPPLLFVRLTEEGMLQYIICLRKNKALAYVTNKEVPITEDDNHEWKAFIPDEYIKMKNSTYCYTVVADDVDYDEIRRHSGCYCYKENDVGSPRDAFAIINKRNSFVENLMKVSSGYSEGDTIAVVEDDPNYEPVIAETARDLIIDNSKGANFSYKAHYNPTKGNKKVLVTESITGHNSTDRLVRHPIGGVLDMTWFYQHLRALKSSVTIVDERLFKRINQSEEEVLGFLDKRLYICNIEIDDKTKKVQFHFYRWEQVVVIENEGKENETKKMKRVRKENVVNLKWSENKLTMDDLAEDDSENFKGNLISIHQGILDKLYDEWNVVGDVERGRLISALYKLLAATPNIIHSDTKPDFLCDFIIHSGRAKPPKKQMPLDLPFVPYSSIERAVMDCKYTLVELLSTARYV